MKEFTVEAGRPDSISREKLEWMKQAGVTRVSINPQSMNQATLDRIGRRHSAGEISSAMLLAREAGFRLAIANANVPNMLGQISTTLAGASLNIHDMVNKSKGELAFTLVDVDSIPTDALLARLAAIPGVLRVRFLPRASTH